MERVEYISSLLFHMCCLAMLFPRIAVLGDSSLRSPNWPIKGGQRRHNVYDVRQMQLIMGRYRCLCLYIIYMYICPPINDITYVLHVRSSNVICMNCRPNVKAFRAQIHNAQQTARRHTRSRTVTLTTWIDSLHSSAHGAHRRAVAARKGGGQSKTLFDHQMRRRPCTVN